MPKISAFLSLGVYNNLTQMTALYSEFITGKDFTPNHEHIINGIQWLKDKDLKYVTID